MDVDGTSDGAVGSIDDHRDDLFVDQVASVGSDNVATEHTISVCVGDELNETCCLADRPCFAHPGELLTSHGDAMSGRTSLCFSEADRRDLGVDEDCMRDHLHVRSEPREKPRP